MTNVSNHHSLYPRDEREALSALFDGELPQDAARFALKRLDHDTGWRDTCGRWQLIGDALRGEATLVAPMGFAPGVARMLAAQEQHVAGIVQTAEPVQVTASAQRGVRRRWIGGAALAASVAVAAVIAVRPLPPSSGRDVQVVAEAIAPGAIPVTAAQPEQPVPEPGAGGVAASEPASAVAVADSSRTPRRAARSVRTSRPDSSPAASLPSAASAPPTAVAAASTVSRPFHPETDDIVTRPWPRAVLPDAATGSVTVDFGSREATTSTFYPFEPRLPSGDTPPAEPQR